jgi:hypothetical protein
MHRVGQNETLALSVSATCTRALASPELVGTSGPVHIVVLRHRNSSTLLEYLYWLHGVRVSSLPLEVPLWSRGCSR